jgi:maltodextrin utilization protein YvdJ
MNFDASVKHTRILLTALLLAPLTLHSATYSYFQMAADVMMPKDEIP